MRMLEQSIRLATGAAAKLTQVLLADHQGNIANVCKCQAGDRMPTNLPPDHFNLERRFRQAETTEAKIELLQEIYSVVPKHKATDHRRANLALIVIDLQ
jgi:hypothetical protein